MAERKKELTIKSEDLLLLMESYRNNIELNTMVLERLGRLTETLEGMAEKQQHNTEQVQENRSIVVETILTQRTEQAKEHNEIQEKLKNVIEEKLKNVIETGFTETTTLITGFKDLIKNTMRSIKLSAAIFGIAVLLASLVVSATLYLHDRQEAKKLNYSSQEKDK